MLFHAGDIFIIALLALLIDRWVGEFKFVRHPVILVGDVIKGFEKNFYQSRIFRGALLTLFMVSLMAFFGLTLQYFLDKLPGLVNLIITAILASILLAHRMLHDSVLSLIQTDQPQIPLKMLVSRDTEQLNDSDCYKAGIESYAENLSDGVIAPLFYLLLFGLPGILIYKAINTLDSMVGYRTERYEKFGKFSAKLDDIVNWIPARLTAVMIMLVNFNWKFWQFYQQGSLHDSPNAGHPITAMALNIGCQLGGDTVYFGTLKKKALFGCAQNTTTIRREHVQHCLANRITIDLMLYSLLSIAIIFSFTLSFIGKIYA
jgi:adenosylcobinamide-phosphate synthase